MYLYTCTLSIPKTKSPNPKQAVPHGQFLNIQVSCFLPDPRALNSCMHTFPETNAGCTMV